MRVPRLRWWTGHPQGRRPVSRMRQAIGLAMLLCVAAGWVGYRYITDETRLRAFAERWLADFSGGEVHIDHVELAPFSGLHLVGVTIAVPESTGFYPAESSLDDRTLFTAGTLFLRLRPFSLATGDLVVPEIIAVNPRLTLVRRAEDGEGNWTAMLARRKPTKPGKGPPRLPEIRLRNMEVRQYRINERGGTDGVVQTFYAGAKPDPRQPEQYDLHITKLIASEDGSQWSGEAGSLKIDMQTGALSGSLLPALSLEELRFAAPREINRWLDTLELTGTVRAETLRFDPRKGAQARLRLDQASLSVPIDEVEAANPAIGRYIRFSNVAGTIVFDERQAEIELEGLFRDSSIRLAGRLSLSADAAGLDGIGLDVQLTATGVPLPRCDEDTSEPEKRFVRRWHRLAAFVEDFDGRGNVDLSVRLRKEPGPDKGIEFLGGKLIPRGVSAAFKEFPYRLDDMSGDVHFLRDGTVELERLTGTHGRGRVVISGVLGGYTSHDSVRLDIQGRNISLDADLLDRLTEEDRALCRRFLEWAELDLEIHLERPAADWSGPPARWTAGIDATFRDGRFVYANFPYVLDQLSGRVRIAGGTMRLEDLTGRHGDAVVRVSGIADRDGDRAGSLDVRLHAERLNLDDDLAAALPPEIRETYQRYAPGGRAEVSGRLYTITPGETPRFDLTARLQDAALNIPIGTARLDEVRGTLRIVPELLEVISLEGRLGRSVIEVQGQAGLTAASSQMSVRVRSEALELDDRLRAALPGAMQAVFDAFSPRGRVRFDLQYTSAPSSDEAAAVQRDEYKAQIEPLDCQVTFAEFPLPLDNVRGKVMFTPGEVRIENLTARHGDLRLSMAGCLPLDSGPVRVHLNSLEARNLVFSDELRRAMPWRLKRLWRDVQPTGTCDLYLRDIRVSAGDDGQYKWNLTGRVDLRQAGMTAGAQITDVQGSLEGVVGFDEQLYAGTHLKLNQARVDGRLVTDASARIERLLGSSVIKIADVTGTLYGGTLLGELEVDYAVQPPLFGLNLTARSVSLEDFLNDGTDASGKPVRLKGTMEGKLALSGQFGRPEMRKGSGSVVIHEAQMAKLPMILGIMQVVHMSLDDDNAFHDALGDFIVDGDDIILERIDLRGKAISMVGAGWVQASDLATHLILLVGSPLNLPRMGVLSELVEGVAREVMEVHVEGTLHTPLLRADIVRSVRKTVEAMTSLRAEHNPSRATERVARPGKNSLRSR